ncbi:MAG: substrate-binding domain-containing protein, partial [Nitrospiraceae bacterium]
VAGCDPAIFLAGEYLRRRRDTSAVVGWTLGSAAAIEALKSGEVHIAGLHVVDPKSGESNLPYLRKHLVGNGFTVVTFASWEEGLMVQAGNPKDIRSVADVARKGIVLVNREQGAGARSLLDQKLSEAGILAQQLNGYERLVSSHLEVARLVAAGQADVGIGVRSVARLLGLDFLPLQEARYDLVVPTAYLTDHPSLAPFMDTIVSRQFRSEVDALGGYDTRETGKLQTL